MHKVNICDCCLSAVVHVIVPEHEKTLIVLLFLKHESSTTVTEACLHLQVCVTSLLNTVKFLHLRSVLLPQH